MKENFYMRHSNDQELLITLLGPEIFSASTVIVSVSSFADALCIFFLRDIVVPHFQNVAIEIRRIHSKEISISCISWDHQSSCYAGNFNLSQ